MVRKWRVNIKKTRGAGMTDEDLGAIYQYLRTIPAVRNRVEKFTPRQQ